MSLAKHFTVRRAFAALAQTTGALLVAVSAATAQSTIVYAKGSAKTIVTNAQVNSNLATYTNIYVVFPPAYGTNNNANFANHVMTQNAIDGVTLQIPWNVVEKPTSPSTTPCSPVGTDTCQQNQTNASYYHSYDWTPVDGSTCTDTAPYSSYPWFCSFGGNNKTVNFILGGTSDPPTNLFTPAYVTSPDWIAAVGGTYGQQDVANTINTVNATYPTGCGKYSGSISVPAGARFTGDGVHTVNVTLWSSPPVSSDDMIWVSSLTQASLNVTGQYAARVATSGCGVGAVFCYTVTGTLTGSSSGSSALMVKARESWPVPYEPPYASAWLAFLKAAIYHFNHLNTPGTTQNLAHIRYVRPGMAKGGEAQPICTTTLPMTNTTPLYSETQWVAWYTQVVQAVQSANPLMQIMLPINDGTTTASPIPIADFATDEAAVAVTYANSTGLYNGFGSQGLKHSDSGFQPNNCPDTGNTPDSGNNWGCMFTKYWSGSVGAVNMSANRTTVPLELQQIDCSNPTGTFNASDGCFIGSSGGQTGNLGDDYVFATANHASILEVYTQDALLAYDPNFCFVNGGTCTQTGGYDWFGTNLSASTQYDFYIHAGQGTSGCSGSTCPYATAINSAHGTH